MEIGQSKERRTVFDLGYTESMEDLAMSDRQQQACPPQLLEERRRWVLHDKKWHKFLSHARLFRYTSFVECVFAAGSMALGNVHKDSDFDVIVAVRTGRMFTARFCAYVIFGMFGWRRNKLDHDKSASDKLCFNHFVTRRGYRLAPPHQEYWRNLYRNLVPIFGPTALISFFFEANRDWAGVAPDCPDDLRHQYRNSSFFKKTIEFLLGGFFGDQAEKILKTMQVKKIERSLKTHRSGWQPRIKYTDDELEFHFHPLAPPRQPE